MTHREEVASRLSEARRDENLQAAGRDFLVESFGVKYSYNFEWLGRPVIQYPADIVALQEILWETKPDVVVETGVAHGGSLVLYASLLFLNAATADRAASIDRAMARGKVLGVEIALRDVNRAALEAHPLSDMIDLIDGSSVAPEVVEAVKSRIPDGARVMVVLDSNHTYEHVRGELDLYADLVTPGCYCVVFDTLVEDLPAHLFVDRPWGPGDNPATAVRDFLARRSDFEVDDGRDGQLVVSAARGGYLRRRSK